MCDSVSTTNATTTPAHSDPTPAGTPVLDLFSLEGQTAIVTGGTRGIGAACAIALAEAGADIILIQRRKPIDENGKFTIINEEDPNIKTYLHIKNVLGKRCEIVLGDLLDSKTMILEKLFDDCLNIVLNDWKKNGIEILVNSAGISKLGSCLNLNEDEWDEVMDVNLKSIFFLSQLAGKHMIPRRYGKIINLGSIYGFQAHPLLPSYVASKHALSGVTKAMSNEWSQHNINVNSIGAGYVVTDLTEAAKKDENLSQQISGRTAAGRWGEVEDLKGPIVFLASRASTYMNGETIMVDGGWLAK